MPMEVLSYNTLEGEATGEIVVKKSRFIANIFHVESEDEALSILERMRKQYWDARHNCYGYIIGKNKELVRFSDDGEPGGTAGKPILEVIKGRDLTDILVVVTRYFGGVLLGTGGLVRAYTDATIEGLSNANLVIVTYMQKLGIEVDYNTIGKLKYVLSTDGIMICDETYTDKVSVVIAIPIEDTDRVTDKLVDVTGGRAVISKLSKIYMGLSIS